MNQFLIWVAQTSIVKDLKGMVDDRAGISVLCKEGNFKKLEKIGSHTFDKVSEMVRQKMCQKE